jgi:hypothetical protein
MERSAGKKNFLPERWGCETRVWIALSTRPFPLFVGNHNERSFQTLFIQSNPYLSAISYLRINGSRESILMNKCDGDEEKPHEICKFSWLCRRECRNFGLTVTFTTEASEPQRKFWSFFRY